MAKPLRLSTACQRATKQRNKMKPQTHAMRITKFNPHLTPDRRLDSPDRTTMACHAGWALLTGITLAAAGCAGEVGALRNLSEAKVPSAPVAPRLSQVALASQIVGAVGSDADSLLGYSVAVGDFNHDGFADVAAGLPGAEHQRGAVAIIYGNANGMDLNNPDLSTRTRLTAGALVGFGLEQDGDQIGYALAAGDFDGDGFTDLAIGAPFRAIGDQVGAGRVYVVYGSAEKGAAGLIQRLERITQTGSGAANEAGDHFGMALVVGDFNGDGYDDLAMGAPDEDDNTNNRADSGAVFIRYGSRSGLTSTGYHYITAATRSPTTGANLTEAGERFGACLAAGQLHINPYHPSDDLVVGAPGKDVLIYSASAGFRNVAFENCGKAYVYNWQNTDDRLHHQWDIIPDTWPLGVRRFGSALAVGDFDGDGRNDLAVGAPEAGEDNAHDGGRLFVVMASHVDSSIGQRAFPEERLSYYLRQPDQVLSESPIAKVEDGDNYAYSLVSADFNHDGFADLAVGAPREDWAGVSDTGLVFVFLGGSDGLAPSFGCDYYFMDQSPVGANEAGDRFGFSLAAGDVNHDGRPDLVIGAPYEDRPEANNGGAVFLALTSTQISGPFDGTWTGTVNGDNRTSATLTLFLCDRDGVVSGSGFLDGAIEKNRCDQTITLQGEADILARKAGPNSTTGTGNLLNFELADNVRADVLVDLSLCNHNNTLTAVIRVRNVQVRVPGIGWVDADDLPGCNPNIDVTVILARVP
jgi:hypothetical protein